MCIRDSIHSLRCNHARAYLDTVPVPPSLRLSDADAVVNFAVVNFGAWEPQAPTPASQPRLVTVVNTCKAAISIMR